MAVPLDILLTASPQEVPSWLPPDDVSFLAGSPPYHPLVAAP